MVYICHVESEIFFLFELSKRKKRLLVNIILFWFLLSIKYITNLNPRSGTIVIVVYMLNAPASRCSMGSESQLTLISDLQQNNEYAS